VSAARWANRRRSGSADFLFPLAIEALDDIGALAFPKPTKPLHEGSGGGRSPRPRLQPRSFRYNWGGSRSSRCKVSAALPAHRALGGGILMLFKAAVWTFHTDFNRRRLCHGLAKKVNLCACPERRWLYRLLATNYVRTCLSGLGCLRIAANTSAACNLRLADERGPFLNHETCRFQVTL